MNVELLRKIAQVIQERPSNFNMNAWHRPCGTTHCIGGWAQVLAGVPETDDSEQMAGLLGIGNCQAKLLFFASEWPEQFLPDDYEETEESPCAGQAAARIEHFIATEGRE